jgi:7-cyano-7-deazaguanine reductase
VHISHEEATNKIYSELQKKLNPRFLEVIGDFNPRGNVKTVVKVSSEENRLLPKTIRWAIKPAVTTTD